MRIRSFSALIVTLTLILGIWAGSPLAQKRKGGGGGRPSNDTPAQFLFPVVDPFSSTGIVTGDEMDLDSGFTSYVTDPEDGPRVIFDGAGSPHLHLDDPNITRSVFLRLTPGEYNPDGLAPCDVPAAFGGGIDAMGRQLWFVNMGTGEPEDPDNEPIQGEFLGIAEGETGQSQMILEFFATDDAPDADPDKDYLWRLVFGGFVNTETERVLVTRGVGPAANIWTVTGKNAEFFSLGRVVRIETIREKKKETVIRTFRGNCSVFIDFDVVKLPVP